VRGVAANRHYFFIDRCAEKWLKVGSSGEKWISSTLRMDSLSPHQHFYAGEFRHSIDEKNRITVPSRWRRDEAEEFILLPEANHLFLLVMSPEEFAGMSSAVESNQAVSAHDRRIFLRHLHSRAQHGIADRQGRLVLPEELCRKIGLKDEVALVGGRGRFEIWNLHRWKRAHEEETPTYQHVANVIGL
jgi:MraZ protein